MTMNSGRHRPLDHKYASSPPIFALLWKRNIELLGLILIFNLLIFMNWHMESLPLRDLSQGNDFGGPNQRAFGDTRKHPDLFVYFIEHVAIIWNQVISKCFRDVYMSASELICFQAIFRRDHFTGTPLEMLKNGRKNYGFPVVKVKAFTVSVIMYQLYIYMHMLINGVIIP